MTTSEQAQTSDKRNPAPGGPGEDHRHPPWVVMKFGGTSVSTAENWRTIVSRVRHECGAGRQVMIVVSAVSGVTDLLQRIATAPPPEVTEALLRELDAQHERLAGTLDIQLGPEYQEARAALASCLEHP